MGPVNGKYHSYKFNWISLKFLYLQLLSSWSPVECSFPPQVHLLQQLAVETNALKLCSPHCTLFLLMKIVLEYICCCSDLIFELSAFAATRLRSRLRTVAYVTSLDCLRQKISSFENFGCMYITAFASISSNRNQGSFNLEELGPSKWYPLMCKRKSCFVQKATFSWAKSLKASEVIQIPMTKADLFLRIFEGIT